MISYEREFTCPRCGTNVKDHEVYCHKCKKLLKVEIGKKVKE